MTINKLMTAIHFRRKRPQKIVGRPLLDRIAAVNAMRAADAALMAEVYAHFMKRKWFSLK